MTNLGFFIRFTLTYSVVMAVTGIAAGLIGFENAGSLNAPILLGISYWCFYSYSVKNSRIIVGKEKWRLILLAMSGDILTNILLATPTAIANGIPAKFILLGMVVVIPIHLLAFIGMAFVVKRQILKQRPEFGENSTS